MKLRRNFKQNR